MKHKPVVRRTQVDQDIQDSIAHYLHEKTPARALKFIDAVEQAFVHISHHPASGSPRYAHELDLPNLRCWQLKRFPHLVFYIERDDHIDVWRLLHSHRDIPAWMHEPDSL